MMFYIAVHFTGGRLNLCKGGKQKIKVIAIANQNGGTGKTTAAAIRPGGEAALQGGGKNCPGYGSHYHQNLSDGAKAAQQTAKASVK